MINTNPPGDGVGCMDTFSMDQGFPVPEVVTGKPISIGLARTKRGHRPGMHVHHS